VHKGAWGREPIEGRGASVVFLPLYSPDLKWDEKAEIMLREGPKMVET